MEKEIGTERSVKSYAKHRKRFTQGIFDCCKEILQELTPLGESGSEVSHLITEPIDFAEVTKLSDNIKKSWLKENLKETKNLINNKTFLIEDQNEGESVTPCMDVYK